jgi:hypothetical protein
MTERTSNKRGPERVYEHAPDPAEAANRPLEPKAPGDPLLERDESANFEATRQPEPHHRLATSVGEPDETADSDPYRRATEDDEADRASGTTGAGQGAER